MRRISWVVAILALLAIAGCGGKSPREIQSGRGMAARKQLAADRDGLAALDTHLLELSNQMIRGWKPKGFEQKVDVIAQQASNESARLRGIANQRRSPAYQDLSEWAASTAAFAKAARHLGPDPGKPGYKNWDAEIDGMRSEWAEAESRAFNATVLQTGLASAESMISDMAATGFASERIQDDAKMLRDNAHKYANDTPEGRAARERADVLQQNLDDLEAKRPYTSIDMKPYLQDLAAAGERAIATVDFEIRNGSLSPAHR